MIQIFENFATNKKVRCSMSMFKNQKCRGSFPVSVRKWFRSNHSLHIISEMRSEKFGRKLQKSDANKKELVINTKLEFFAEQNCLSSVC